MLCTCVNGDVKVTCYVLVSSCWVTVNKPVNIIVKHFISWLAAAVKLHT